MTVKRFDISGEHYEVFGDNNGEYCLYEDYAELQRQLTAYEATVTNLEAEAKTLKAGVKHLGEKAQGLAVEAGLMRQLLPDYVSCPNTDAALAEIRNDARAEGLIMAIEHIQCSTSPSNTVIRITEHFQILADRLRKEQGK